MKKIGIIIVFIFSLILTSCVEDRKENITTNRPDKIVSAILPSSLISDSKDLNLKSVLFEGLLSNENGIVTNALIKSYEISEDRITYRFKLREDIYFSDATKIVAEDFVTFFKNILSEDSSFEFKEELYSIYGVREYAAGLFDFSNVAIRAVNSTELEIRLNYIDENLLKTLSSANFGLIKIKEGSEYSFNDALNEYKKSYKDILYTGKYIIGNVKNSDEVNIYINRNYYDINKKYEDKIIYKNEDYAEENLIEFQNKKIDAALSIPVSEYQNVKDRGNLVIKNKNNIISLYFNENKLDYEQRKEISNIVDANKILEEEFFMIKDKIDKIDFLNNNENIQKSFYKSEITLVVEKSNILDRISRNIKKQIEEEIGSKVLIKYIEDFKYAEYQDEDMFLISIPNILNNKIGNLISYQKIYNTDNEFNNILRIATIEVKSSKVIETEEYLKEKIIFKPLFYDILIGSSYKKINIENGNEFLKNFAKK